MRSALTAASVFVLWLATSVGAHRLDEYLQATTISLERDRVQVDIRLAPGVTVWPQVLARIDTGKDGLLSEDEVRAYAARMQRDLSIAMNGRVLTLRMAGTAADDVAAFGRGRGEIHLRFVADVPPSGKRRRLVFENRHERSISSYLVNALKPDDPHLRITAQHRNRQQSVYQLDYVHGAASDTLSGASH